MDIEHFLFGIFGWFSLFSFSENGFLLAFILSVEVLGLMVPLFLSLWLQGNATAMFLFLAPMYE